MNYTTLIASQSTPGSIANWVNHVSAQAAAAQIIEEAESFIYRRMRHWRMLTRTSGTIPINQDYLAISGITNYLEDKTLMLTGQYKARIVRKPEQEVLDRYQYDGSGNRVPATPCIFYNDQTNIWFDCPAIQAYPYLLTFYQQPQPLASTLTNFLTTYYQRLLRCAIMAGAVEFMKDSGSGQYDRTYWEQLAIGEIEIANSESDRGQRSVEAGAIIV